MLELFLIIAVIAVIFLAVALYFTYKNTEEVELALTEANADNALLQRKIETLTATNETLRAEVRQQGATIIALTAPENDFEPLANAVDEIEPTNTEEPNPQHFRPMFDSQGPLFNTEEPVVAVDSHPVVDDQPETQVAPLPYEAEFDISPKNDIMFFPETYEEEVVGDTGESAGPESVQDGEEASNGVLRSESVS